ncbi:MAG: peptide MFS transporter [Sandaracinus sp.]|nr:peptide MFS transporter [Sandaracinus sp.]
MTEPKLKQPRALYMLFFAEMWERFSFYGMRALLTLYLVRQLFAEMTATESDAKAKGIYAAYGALVYATPFVGGILADRVLGYKRSVMLGAVLMAIGHFVMAIETEFFLYVALAFLIVGNGFFKPNISSMVGGLYPDRNDPRRDGAFTIFYMGINLGAGVAPLLCGYLGEKYGWSYGFGLAGIGMLAGLVVFGMGSKQLGENGDPPNDTHAKKVAGLSIENWTYAGAFASVAGFALLVRYFELMTYVLTPFSLLVVGIIFVAAIQSPKVVRERLFVVLILLFFTTVFWAFFEQAGSSLTLFTDTNVERHGLPASVFQSVNPAFILLLAPVFSSMWVGLGRKGKEPSIPVKFALGIAQLGVGFLVLAWSGGFVADGEITVAGEGGVEVTQAAAVVPLLFLIGGYLLHTTGELCLSPIGLSMVTKLSPHKITAMVMGGWFLSSAMAHHLAGLIALLTSPPETGAAAGTLAVDTGLIASVGDRSVELLTSYDNLANYLVVFKQIGYVALGVAVLCFAMAPLLTKWMHLDAPDTDELPAAKPPTEPQTF